MKRSVLIVGLLVGCFGLQGCMVAAIGAGVGAWKYGNSKKVAAQGSSYNEYLLGMEEINLKRSAAGLRPEYIMSQDQYMGKTKQ